RRGRGGAWGVERAAGVVRARLRSAILGGDPAPTAPLSQVRLAARLGVSRPPLREALRMLQREGLIDSEPNRRVRVAKLSLADLEQLYAGRVLIEALAVRLTVPAYTVDDLAEPKDAPPERPELKGQTPDHGEEAHP